MLSKFWGRACSAIFILVILNTREECLCKCYCALFGLHRTPTFLTSKKYWQELNSVLLTAVTVHNCFAPMSFCLKFRQTSSNNTQACDIICVCARLCQQIIAEESSPLSFFCTASYDKFTCPSRLACWYAMAYALIFTFWQFYVGKTSNGTEHDSTALIGYKSLAFFQVFHVWHVVTVIVARVP